MKKNIVIALLIITNLLSFVHAFIQKAQAKKQERLAIMNAESALEINKLYKVCITELSNHQAPK